MFMEVQRTKTSQDILEKKDSRFDLPAMKSYYSNKIIWFGNREKEFKVNERTEKQIHRVCRILAFGQTLQGNP